MVFQDVAFLPSPELVFSPLFLKIFVVVNAYGPSRATKLWLGISMDILQQAPTKPLFVLVEFHGDHKTITKFR